MLTCQWIKESSLTDIKGQGTMAPRLSAQRHSAECHFDGWRSAFWMVNFTVVSTVTVLFRLCHSDECHSAECRGTEWEQLKANQSIGNVFTLNFSSWRCSKLFIQKRLSSHFENLAPFQCQLQYFLPPGGKAGARARILNLGMRRIVFYRNAVAPCHASFLKEELLSRLIMDK